MGEDKETNVWKIIKWFCNWFFGRDDYEDKVIVYETEKAICCKYLDEEWRWCYLTVANFEDEREKNWCIHQWEQWKSMFQDKWYMSN